MRTDKEIVENLLPSERDLEKAGQHYWGGDYEPSYQDIINLRNAYKEVMSDRLLTTLNAIREEERIALHNQIGKIGTEVYEEMKKAIYEQHNLFAMINPDMVNHIVHGIVSNMAIRMNETLTPPN